MMKKTLAAGLVFTSLFLSVPTSRAQPRAETVKAMYSTIGGSQAVLWIAKEAGFFKKNGLEVEPVYVSGGSANVAALLSGEAVFSQNAGPPVVGADLKGADIVFIAGVINQLPYVLISSKEIKRAEDLRGKKVGISRFGASSEMVARLALRKLGIDDKTEVTLMQVGGVMERFASLQSGMIQATVAELPVPPKLQEAGYQIHLDLTKAGVPYQHTGLTVRRKFIEAKPETVRRFVRAYVEGIHYFKTRKKASAGILTKYLRTADQRFLAETVEVFAEYFPKAPYPAINGLKTVLEFFYPDKASTVNPGDFVDMRFVRELEESGFIERLY
ncbi:MAG: ABC transporter substrate-binding protein [Deltaproteobacteria bacterium]|nr:ABC transporter substrate-binding protein [Deltaproteobacteria bacterium]